MRNLPDISVVIPLYNKDKYIERAVRSVLAQTHPNFELIVVNDGSTDRSLHVVKSISDYRIKLISQNNQGVSAARNLGIREASSDLIAFLDADDEYLPEMLETLLRLYINFPEAGAYATSYQICKAGQTTIRDVTGIPNPPWEGIIHNYFYLRLNSMHVPHNCSSTAIPRRVFEEVGYFPEGERHGEDVDMFCRIAMVNPFVMSTKVCSTYYADTENKSSRSWHDRMAFISTIRKACRAGIMPDYMREDALEYAAFQEINSAERHLSQGELNLARKMLLGNKTKRFRRDKWHIFLMTFEHIKILHWILCRIRLIRDSIKKTKSREEQPQAVK